MTSGPETDSAAPVADEPARAPLTPEAVLRPGALLDTAQTILNEHVGRGRRGLALCAAASGAGVSFVTASLAMAIARAGVSTLVVDANLHRPAMHDLMVPDAPIEGGLLQVLRDEVDPGTVITEWTAVPNLSVLYAGGSDKGVEDLFDTDAFHRAMAYCLRTYGLTLIDAPPANRCAETRRIAAVTGYAAIIARRDVSYAEDITALLADLQLNRVEVIGTILNEG
ncbi:MAG TPA: CpsD/CapB family tyrosine-protein kinase [Phenylobacterium sp.]